MKLEIDLTSLTEHPDWKQLAALVDLLEKRAVSALTKQENPAANRFLIVLTELKAEVARRSRTPNVWKVTHE